ncbi:hypothetical protein TCON_0307 [Astathelohania contejeani]|uniref:FCP1 homology domain-containing protein n=1 Tax=Astathelohania contejeani TaxID=164912 RepID=A0ABQ7I236_9MICR|nr:hypothetical protein TCON_0307 [Thelohania contejeani]
MEEDIKKRPIIVLDINGTLLKRVHRSKSELLRDYKERGITPDISTKDYHMYIRPNINVLINTLHSLPVNYVFWSTAYKHNVKVMADILASLGMDRAISAYDQTHCDKMVNRNLVMGNPKMEAALSKIKADRFIKDLSKISKWFDIPLEYCCLVDDNEMKSIGGQNFIEVCEFDPIQEDNELIRLSKELERFISHLMKGIQV